MLLFRPSVSSLQQGSESHFVKIQGFKEKRFYKVVVTELPFRIVSYILQRM